MGLVSSFDKHSQLTSGQGLTNQSLYNNTFKSVKCHWANLFWSWGDKWDVRETAMWTQRSVKDNSVLEKQFPAATERWWAGPLRPMETDDGVNAHLLAMEDPTLEQVTEPEEGHNSERSLHCSSPLLGRLLSMDRSHAGAVCEELQPCRMHSYWRS